LTCRSWTLPPSQLNSMSSAISESRLNAWSQGIPSLCGIPGTDMQALSRYVEEGEALLDSLGPKPARSREQAREAASIHGACRVLRRRFMSMHRGWLYRVLTKDFTVRKGLRELVFDAAECCPGLVPTPEQMARERARLQRDKEGYEIDQGIFFHALFRSPEIGRHLVESMLRPTPRSLELLEPFRSDGRLDLGSVLIERRGCSAYLTINNAGCLNAEDNRLVDDLETAVDLALLADPVQVGVLRGGIMTHPRYAGRRVFSAGINLKALHAGQISFVDFLLRRELGFIHKIVRGLLLENENSGMGKEDAMERRTEKPWIAAVDSFAIGGGAQLLLVFDRVIAAADTYFSLPAAQEGIIPGFSNLRLARFLGSRKTRQVILSGRKIGAHEADAQFLFDEVLPSSELDAAVERNAQQLSNSAVVANRHILNIAEEPLEAFLQYAAEFALVQAERLYSPDVLDNIGRA
jgi:(3,5-dihydroxyphenyl)acetyl-CoA 1,2-dioxygenase